jgi:hypothetical protein
MTPFFVLTRSHLGRNSLADLTSLAKRRCAAHMSVLDNCCLCVYFVGFSMGLDSSVELYLRP